MYSGYKQNGWPEIQAAMQKTWPDIPLLPYMMVATTDSRHYQELTGGIFRFSPFKLDPKELRRVHGHDERISIKNLRRGLMFYTELLRSL